MPFMNKALARLVQEEHPQYANDADDQVSYAEATGNVNMNVIINIEHAACNTPAVACIRWSTK